MARKALFLLSTLVTAAITTSSALAHGNGRVCWPTLKVPAVTIPAVTIPAVTIPAVTIPATTVPRTCFGGTCYPAQHYPAQHYTAQHYSAQHYPAQHYAATSYVGGCFTSRYAPAPPQTTVRTSNYAAIDPAFSQRRSTAYWDALGAAASYPDVGAPGFGGVNAAGFPKEQYVRSYIRSDGTFVSGYWRNSPTDGLPTCEIISC